jgi:AICAR transformylase/IMP cyclohydrolase PurH
MIKREVSDGIIAPGYEPEALEILKTKRKGAYNISQDRPRLRSRRDRAKAGLWRHFRAGEKTISRSTKNFCRYSDEKQRSAGERRARPYRLAHNTQIHAVELRLLRYDGQAIGVGAGQQSRIHCTRLAGSKADTWFLRQHDKVLGLPFLETLGRPDRDNVIDGYINQNEEDVCADGVWQKYFKTRPAPFTKEEQKAYLSTLDGVSLGSDAFFPFDDNIERARRSGVSYIAEPGGSIRDDLVIECCDKYGIVMAFTKMRLFHH